MSTKRLQLIAACSVPALFTGVACASGPTTSSDTDVRLVVVVSVDQLRDDLLDRYDALFTGGLRRLLDDGHRFEGSSHDHALTQTAPGHVTIGTGVFPSRHGVVANSWVERDGDGWRSVYSVEDLDHPILGIPDLPGRSPANIRREGLADWMRSANPESKVFSIARKDRSAIGLAGNARGEVYWVPPSAGRFVTSTFYRDEYPDWVVRFNDEVMPTFYADSVWEAHIGPDGLALVRGDTASYEGDGEHTAFPHRFPGGDTSSPAAFNTWVAQTPFLDAATLAFAAEGLEALALGQDSAVDFMGIGLSQTDAVGHLYGPLSREQLDNLLRLDHELGIFFERLDQHVGLGQWIVAFSADHGVLTTPEALLEAGEDAGRLTREQANGLRSLIRGVGQEEGSEDPEVRTAALALALEELDFIEDAIPFDELARTQSPPDSFFRLYQNSYFPGRVTGPVGSLGLEVRALQDFLLSAGPARGTSHGSPYWYDRSVPVIFLGADVTGGASGPAHTVDIAPTLAELIGVGVPPDLDGEPLLGSSGPSSR
jgi:hypothetical protein